MAPYIPEEQRGSTPKTPGQLAYVIADDLNYYLEGKDSISFSDLNEVVGVLAGVQAEFYRRVVAPYEDRKLSENGEVFTMRLPIMAQKSPPGDDRTCGIRPYNGGRIGQACVLPLAHGGAHSWEAV